MSVKQNEEVLDIVLTGTKNMWERKPDRLPVYGANCSLEALSRILDSE